MAAEQAGAALHTMAILQAYQAEVLKEMDEGDGVTPEAVTELRRATGLTLRATKHTVDGWTQYDRFGGNWAPPVAESYRDQEKGEGEGFPSGFLPSGLLHAAGTVRICMMPSAFTSRRQGSFYQGDGFPPSFV